MRWLATKRAPKETDCENLKQELMKIRNEHVGSVGYISRTETGALSSVCWAFWSWLQDYAQYVICPVVCIDGKANFNAYSLSLVTINARTNNSSLCTVFMGFLSDETEDTFNWLFARFKESIFCDTIMIAMDQQAACMICCRNIFPLTYITVDDWHLNHNLLKNVWAWLTKIRKREWKKIWTMIFLCCAKGAVHRAF